MLDSGSVSLTNTVHLKALCSDTYKIVASLTETEYCIYGDPPFGPDTKFLAEDSYSMSTRRHFGNRRERVLQGPETPQGNKSIQR
jgi:hypothetical protein